MKIKKIILISLLLVFALTIGAVSAMDNNATNELINIENDNGNIEMELNEISSENTTDNSEILGVEEQSDETTLNSNDEDKYMLSSAISENSLYSDTYDTSDTEVYLYSSYKDGYILHESISKYPNSNIKFNIIVFPHTVNKTGGSVTLKYNGNSYTANIFDGKATIIAKAPSKLGSYKATLSYSGYTYVDQGWKYNPSSSTFTLKVKKFPTTVKAPKITANYKANKYFKITVKQKGKAVKNLKLKVKVFTGKKYKTYTIKTNKKGMAKLSTKKFKVGSHKVVIKSGNNKYNVKKNSKIIIKKAKKSSKSASKTVKLGKYKVKLTNKDIKKIKKGKQVNKYTGKYLGNKKVVISISKTANDGGTKKGKYYAEAWSGYGPITWKWIKI